MPGESVVDVDIRDMKRLLATIGEEFGPAAVRNVRRNLRAVGDGIIAEQKRILSGALPGNARRTGKKVVRVKPSGRNKSYLRTVNTYEAQEAARSRSRGMRDDVKKSLRTAVRTPSKRAGGIRITARKSVAGSMGRIWNARVFRHQVFGKGPWVSQYGQPYWWEPIKKGGEDARRAAEKAINDALAGKG